MRFKSVKIDLHTFSGLIQILATGNLLLSSNFTYRSKQFTVVHGRKFADVGFTVV